MVDLIMPKMGESITEATILKWHKKVGDAIKADETVLEIATDKVDTEVPASSEGVLEEILFKENDVVAVGAVIARIKTNGGAATGAPAITTVEEVAAQPHAVTTHQPSGSPANEAPAAANTQSGRFYSPLVLNIATSEGVSFPELEKIPGSGNEGRVTKKDILQYIQDKQAGKVNYAADSAANTPAPSVSDAGPSGTTGREVSIIQNEPVAAPSYGGNVEVIEMDRMRKLIAKHMVDSKNISAHVTSFSEADVTNMVLWRNRVKKEFEKQEGEKITFTPLFIEAVIRSLKKFPWLNSSVEGDKIIIKKDINIGMATALPNGNLIVPVIKNADQLNLVGLSKQVNGLANAARNNKLRPDDTSGGTFTLTNVGTFGSIMGTPIISQPQVAILAVGAIKKKPVVVETPQGDSIAIRHMMYLSLSYDHRIIDGSLGSTFLNAVTMELENFNPERGW